MTIVEDFTNADILSVLAQSKDIKSSAGSPQKIREALQARGFAQFDASAFIRLFNLGHEWEAFAQSAQFLPPDPYCNERNRFRRMARFLFVPGRGLYDAVEPIWDDCLGEWSVTYDQPEAYNSEDGGKKRRFAAFTPAQAWNRAFCSLIQFDFDCLPRERFDQAVGVQVNAHLIRLVGVPGLLASVSPQCFHRDGEQYTFAHLISFDRAIGGEIYIAEAHCADRKFADVTPSEILAGFCLRQPLASYVVDDRMVAHHLQPVGARPGSKSGSRTVLLVDFTPLVPSFSGE